MQIHSAETTTGSADSKVCDCHPVTKNRTQTLTDLITGSENTPTLKKKVETIFIQKLLVNFTNCKETASNII